MCFLWIYFLLIVDVYFILCFGVWGGPGRISRFEVPWSKSDAHFLPLVLETLRGGWLPLPFISEMTSVETEKKKHLTGKFAPGLFKSNGCPNYCSCIPPACTNPNKCEQFKGVAWGYCMKMKLLNRYIILEMSRGLIPRAKCRIL